MPTETTARKQDFEAEMATTLNLLEIKHFRKCYPISTPAGVLTPDFFLPDTGLIIQVAWHSRKAKAVPFAHVTNNIYNLPRSNMRVEFPPEIESCKGPFGVELMAFFEGPSLTFFENWRAYVLRSLLEGGGTEGAANWISSNPRPEFPDASACLAHCPSCKRPFFCAEKGFVGCRYGCKTDVGPVMGINLTPFPSKS